LQHSNKTVLYTAFDAYRHIENEVFLGLPLQPALHAAAMSWALRYGAH